MDPPPLGLDEVLGLVATAARDRNWALLASCAVLGTVWCIRRFGAERVPWLATDKGGAATSLLVAWVGGMVSAAAAGQPIDLELTLSALGVALTASGAWSVGRKLLA